MPRARTSPSRACPAGGARRGVVARYRSRLRSADGARASPVPHRAASRRATRGSTRRSARPSTTRRCSSRSGCHSDAHEQAKWFGDDIALKANKYKYELARPARRRGDDRLLGVAATAASPLPSWARVRALGAPRPRRHDLASRGAGPDAGEQLGLRDEVLEAVGASYERWDGKGWPGRLRGDAIPIAARIAQTRGVRRGGSPRRRGRGGDQAGARTRRQAVRSDGGGRSARDGRRRSSRISTTVRPGTRSSSAEPALARATLGRAVRGRAARRSRTSSI